MEVKKRPVQASQAFDNSIKKIYNSERDEDVRKKAFHNPGKSDSFDKFGNSLIGFIVFYWIFTIVRQVHGRFPVRRKADSATRIGSEFTRTTSKKNSIRTKYNRCVARRSAIRIVLPEKVLFPCRFVRRTHRFSITPKPKYFFVCGNE